MKIKVDKNLWINLREDNKAFTNNGKSKYIDAPHRIIYSTKLKPSDKILLSDIYTTLLRGHTYQKTNEELAKSFHISKSSVSRSFRRLLNQHWINHRNHEDKDTGTYYRQVTAINVKKVFGLTYMANNNFVDNNHLSKFLQDVHDICSK